MEKKSSVTWMGDNYMPMRKPSEEEEKWIKKQEIDKRKEKEDLTLKREHWMKCPNCGYDLHKAAYPKFEYLKMKKCENCGEVCLDRGELEVIIQVEIKSFAEGARELFWEMQEKQKK